MLVAPVENHPRLIRPMAQELVDKPFRMSSAPGKTRVDGFKKNPAFTDEAPQYGIHQTRGRVTPQEPRGLDGQMDRELRGIAGVLDLVGAGDEQRADVRRNLRRSVEERFHRGRQAQIPAQAAQGNGAHRRAMG